MRNSTAPVVMLTMLTCGLVACAGAAPTPARSAGELAGGSAKVIIGGRSAVDTEAVDCAPGDARTTITTGNDDRGTASTVDSADGLSALSVELRDVDGFTGSYWKGLGAAPTVTLVGRTYLIEGTAMGFTSDNPSARLLEKYSIRVAC